MGFTNEAFLMYDSKTKTGHYHVKMDRENFPKYIENQVIPGLSKIAFCF